MFCDRMDVEKSQRVPSFSFFGIETFRNFFPPKRPLRFFFDVLQQWMLKIRNDPPFSARARASGHLARQFRRLDFS